MYTLRCTKALLLKLNGTTAHLPAAPTTTRLGDWYANRLNIGHNRLILCTNERTLLSVVVPAKELRSLPKRIAASVAELLLNLGARDMTVAAEIQEMNELNIAPTASRTVLGSMNDFAFQVRAEIEYSVEGFDWRAVNLRLSDVPCGPLGYNRPADRALHLLG